MSPASAEAISGRGFSGDFPEKQGWLHRCGKGYDEGDRDEGWKGWEGKVGEESGSRVFGRTHLLLPSCRQSCSRRLPGLLYCRVAAHRECRLDVVLAILKYSRFLWSVKT